MPRETVLVLDGQTNQALACVRSLGRAGFRVLVASHRRAPLAAWSRHCDGRFRFADETVPAFATLRQWAIEQGARYVLPVTERSCFLCNAERERWEANGVTVGCAPYEILLRTFDKARTLEYAQGCGVAIPPTCLPTSLAECRAVAQDLGFPLVVKGRFGNAWDGARFVGDSGVSYVRTPGELEPAILAHMQGRHWPLVQGFVPGCGKGVFALCDGGRAVAWFAHERLRDVRPTGSGSSLRRAVALDARLRSPAESLLAALGWHGPAMVEFRDDGVGPPRLMEVNGRFWGSLQLAITAGVDFPRLWLAILRGEPIRSAPSYVEGATLRWLWGDVKRFFYIVAGRPPAYPGPYPTIRQGLTELFGAQPPGTRLEAWEPSDPGPAVGEWTQGIGDLLALLQRRRVATGGGA
jgi:predicted ATP-grasp superfamily ATP-dependent carboligase